MELTVAVSGLHMGENPQPGSGIIRSLRRRYDDLTVVGLVYDSLESGIYADNCADVVYQLPYPKAGSDALLERLRYIHAQNPINVLIPALDSEIHGVLKIQEQLSEHRIRMLLPTMESYRACRKSELAALADKIGCKSPLTFAANEVLGVQRAAYQIGYPLMVKGPYYGAYKVFTEAALIERFHEIIATWGGPVVLQQIILGGEYDVVAVGDGEGDVGGLCAVRKTIISEKGKGFGGITIHDDDLMEISTSLIDELKWQGPIELEFIKSDYTNEFFLIEINPRFPAWVDFPSAFGHNLPALVIERLMRGEMPRLGEHQSGKFFVRHAVDIMGDVAQLGQLSTHGELHLANREEVNA